MKIGFWARLLIALCGLIVVFVAVSIFIFGIGVFPFKLDVTMLNGPFELWERAAMVAAAVLLFALGLHSVCVLFRRKREKGFIIQHTELGDMSISMHAMENMVKKCVDAHQELTVNSARIHRVREGIVVDIKVTLASGVNIPLTVNALQKQIKQYITSCSGIDVNGVRVMVETNTALHADQRGVAEAQPETYTEQVAPDTSAATHDNVAQHIFMHTEEPEKYAPVSETSADVSGTDGETATDNKSDETAQEEHGQAIANEEKRNDNENREEQE